MSVAEESPDRREGIALDGGSQTGAGRGNARLDMLILGGEEVPLPEGALTDRSRQVYKMRVLGHTLRDVARALNVSMTQVRRDFVDAQAFLRRLEGTDLQTEREMALERLNVATAALMPLVRAGKTNAIREFTFVEKRRAELLGLDAPRQIEMTGREGGPVEHDVRIEDLRARYTPEEAAQKAMELARSVTLLTTEMRRLPPPEEEEISNLSPG